MLRYRVKSGKLHVRADGKKTVYRQGQIVILSPSQAAPFMDTLEQLDPNPPPQEPKVGLKAVHAGGGRWNVINEATGKKINDKTMTKKEAHEMASLPADRTDDDATKEDEHTTENEG